MSSCFALFYYIAFLQVCVRAIYTTTMMQHVSYAYIHNICGAKVYWPRSPPVSVPDSLPLRRLNLHVHRFRPRELVVPYVTS